MDIEKERGKALPIEGKREGEESFIEGNRRRRETKKQREIQRKRGKIGLPGTPKPVARHFLFPRQFIEMML